MLSIVTQRVDLTLFTASTTKQMTTINQKHQILESLNLLDQSQAEKVLAYIEGLTKAPREEVNYQRQKREAMNEIRQALGNFHSLYPSL
jgi:hypothetical protein